MVRNRVITPKWKSWVYFRFTKRGVAELTRRYLEFKTTCPLDRTTRISGDDFAHVLFDEWGRVGRGDLIRRAA